MNVDQIIAYEEGDMDEEEMIEMFQEGINSGLVWKLQGHYGRVAKSLLDAGLCQLPVFDKPQESL